MKFVDVAKGEQFRFQGKVWLKEFGKSQCGRFTVNATCQGKTRFFRWDEEVFKVFPKSTESHEERLERYAETGQW